jgi:hypothetical protein
MYFQNTTKHFLKKKKNKAKIIPFSTFWRYFLCVSPLKKGHLLAI